MFKKSYIKEIVTKTTVMCHDVFGICNFEIHGIDASKDPELFHSEYVKYRKEWYTDREPCSPPWNPDQDVGYQNFLRVFSSGEYELEYYESTFNCRVPAQILCCEEWIELSRHTNTCSSCNADYNSGGQLLAPRRFWGEETGEHPSECV